VSNLFFILGSLLASFLLTFVLMPYGIELLTRLKMGKQIREEGLMGKAIEFAKLHEGKKGTPTMGGIFVIVTVIILTILSIGVNALSPWTESMFGWSISHTLWNRQETYIVMFTLLSVGTIGLVDDLLNIRGIGKTKWLSARVKTVLLVIFGFLGAYWFYAKLGYSQIHIPFFGMVDLGYWYVPLFILILYSGANSVNITDWLDGLAGGLLLFQYAAYGFITYSMGLYILSAFCLIIAGALMAFLWFNIHPARVFMGDIGSLSLGATLAVIAMMTDTLLGFIVMSGIFIFETLSVIIQLVSKKFRNGKKVFRIAPFHHHLEAIGWHEVTVVMRLWLIGMVLAVVGTMIVVIR
jgi:phospho-N-acetylmuramoyl-pentapeptide-transferase